MNDKQTLSNVDQARRDFVKRAGRMAVAAPAAVLLLNATAKQADAAEVLPYVVIDEPIDQQIR